MTRAEVYALFLRLTAVYLWVLALGDLVNIGYFLVWASEPGAAVGIPLAAFLVPFAAFAVLGTILFFASPFLAAKLGDGYVPASMEDPVGVGAIGLRIAAILILQRAVATISHALSQIHFAQAGGRWSAVWAYAAVALVLGATSVWLFVRAEAIARRHFGRPAVDLRVGAAPLLQAVAFSVVGLWILAALLPDLIRFGEVSYLTMQAASDGPPSYLRWDWTQTVDALIRLALGLGLFFGGSGLAGLWYRTRTAGLEPVHRKGDS